MKRKLGPLQLWQWILIGAAVGVGSVLYRRGHPGAPSAAQTAAAAALPADAQYNPIDPTTGLPISGSVASTPVSTTPGSDDVTGATPATSFGDLLDNFTMLEGLLAGLQDLQHPPGAAVETDPAAVQTQTGTKRATRPKPKKKPAKAKKHSRDPKNPGHQIVQHGGGRRTPRSSAPHNGRQHHNVQPPAHQRHDPTTHPSAHHPASRAPGHPHTPAAHPPAKRNAAAKREAARNTPPTTHVAPAAPAHHPASSHQERTYAHPNRPNNKRRKH